MMLWWVIDDLNQRVIGPYDREKIAEYASDSYDEQVDLDVPHLSYVRDYAPSGYTQIEGIGF